MTTIVEAIDLINQTFYDAWEADGSVSKGILVYYDNKDENEKDKSASKSWARVTIKHHGDGFGKQSLAAGNGTMSYQRNGVVLIGLFVPLGKGTRHGSELTQIVVNAFEGSRETGVWFRNVRFRENGKSGAWAKIYVKADFNYTEVK